ncbi:hypothetical protein HK097_009251 [Rhizophlyctis rosea]|uniref:Uncharacterized protein n=1 Tax=Rhizophlyctis rosea TaxID=64517 RepID=A0AAD5SKY7_9FUNG|nr:hypothetical protein HK097_009251 [Rhizophlyctis rosea]
MADLPEKNINRIKDVVVRDCEEDQYLKALQRSAHIARCLLKTEAGLDGLLASLDTDEVSRDELLKHFDSFELYVIDWNGAHDAFYTPMNQCASEVKVGSVFVKLEDVRLLPITEPSVWTAAQRAYVLLVAWFIMHEVC